MKTTLNPFENAKRTAQGTGGGVSPTVIEEMQAELSILGSQNETQAQDITDIKGSLNSINDNLTELNKLMVYSTTERKIGTYDGKDVYVKTIVNDSVPSDGIIDSSSIFVGDTLYAIVSCVGSILVQGSPDIFLSIGGFYQSNLGCGIITSNNGLKLYAPGYTIKKCFITITYIENPV